MYALEWAHGLNGESSLEVLDVEVNCRSALLQTGVGAQMRAMMLLHHPIPQPADSGASDFIQDGHLALLYPGMGAPCGGMPATTANAFFLHDGLHRTHVVDARVQLADTAELHRLQQQMISPALPVLSLHRADMRLVLPF